MIIFFYNCFKTAWLFFRKERKKSFNHENSKERKHEKEIFV
jgi:cbb3-type cytochrome oxidase subunit 3